MVTYTEQKENDVHKSSEFVSCFIKHDSRHIYTCKRIHSASQMSYCASAEEFLHHLKYGETENSLSPPRYKSEGKISLSISTNSSFLELTLELNAIRCGLSST